MTPEELMKPRFKVIADYPNNEDWRVGDILDRDWEFNNGTLTTFPHLFKKLEWWEERKVEDLPEYILNKTAIPKVIEKSEWDIDDNGRTMLFVNKHRMNLWGILPATEEEYNTQNKS